MSVTSSPTKQATGARGAMPVSMLDDARRSDTPQLWFDGDLAAADAMQAPLTTHALHYGTRRVRGHPQLCHPRRRGRVPPARAPGAHAQGRRTARHRVRCRRRPSEATLQTLRANGHRDAYIRPLAWCGTGSIGLVRLDVSPLSQHLMVATFATDVHLAGERVRLHRVAVAAQSGDVAAAAEAVRRLRQLDPGQARGQAARFRRGVVRR